MLAVYKLTKKVVLYLIKLLLDKIILLATIQHILLNGKKISVLTIYKREISSPISPSLLHSGASTPEAVV